MQTTTPADSARSDSPHGAVPAAPPKKFVWCDVCHGAGMVTVKQMRWGKQLAQCKKCEGYGFICRR